MLHGYNIRVTDKYRRKYRTVTELLNKNCLVFMFSYERVNFLFMLLKFVRNFPY